MTPAAPSCCSRRVILRTGAALAATALWLAAARASEIFPPGAQPELLWSDGEFTEGVAAAPDGTVYFSDIPDTEPGRILRFDPRSRQTTVHCADSGKSNGLCFDQGGRLIAVCGANGGKQCLAQVLPDGGLKILVDGTEGRRFLSPNDLDIHARGWIYFSDPRYVGPEPLELERMHVFRFDPSSGAVVRTAVDVTKPNGIVIAPDGKTLYVAETDNGAPDMPAAGSTAGGTHMTLNAYPIDESGNVGARRILRNFGSATGIDGMTVDSEGRLVAAIRASERHGIAVISSHDGSEVDFLKMEDLPTNCGFGRGEELSVLYFTAGKSLYRIRLNARGWFPF